MSRSQRLGIVLELAERHEEQTAQAYELARRLWQEDQSKLDELRQYYADYEAAFAAPSACRRAEDFARQRAFLGQLNDAKKQQESVVEKRLEITKSKQRVWQEARLKRKAMQELIDRLRAGEAKKLSKQEAKMLDEWFNQTKTHREQRQIDN
jgi:flagellar protein FliJ